MDCGGILHKKSNTHEYRIVGCEKWGLKNHNEDVCLSKVRMCTACVEDIDILNFDEHKLYEWGSQPRLGEKNYIYIIMPSVIKYMT